MTSNDELQEVATTSGALGGPEKVNVRNRSTLPLPAAPDARTKTGHTSLLISIQRRSGRSFSYFYIYYWKLPSEQENQTIFFCFLITPG